MSLVENMISPFKEFVVSIPRWEIRETGVTALVGPSGSGKTTVLHLLSGLIPCPGMRWTFGDVDLAKLDVRERRLGIVFQTLELFPHMTAEENIFFAARARKIPMAEARKDVVELAKDLKILDCLSRSVQILSGGERQRVALARAIVGRPRMLLLDEPFSSLDIQLRDDARRVVKDVIEKRSIPTLLITHDETDLRVLANQINHIHRGRLVD